MWVRVVAAETPVTPNRPLTSAYDATEFRYAGKGDAGGTIHIPRLDLSHALPTYDPADYAKGTWKTVRVFLEAVLVPSNVEDVRIDASGKLDLTPRDPYSGAFQRTVLEVVLEPRAKVPGQAASPGIHSSGPSSD